MISFASLLAAVLVLITMICSRCHAFSTKLTSLRSQNRIPFQKYSTNAIAPCAKEMYIKYPTTTQLQQSASSDSDKKDEKLTKATKAMTAFTNRYLKNTDTKLCQDLGVAAVVIQGLAEHKVELGAPLCPCRFYENKEKEVKDGYWNCPCVPMRERHECHCMLFLTEDNAFSGDKQEIGFDEVQQLNAKVEK